MGDLITDQLQNRLSWESDVNFFQISHFLKTMIDEVDDQKR